MTGRIAVGGITRIDELVLIRVLDARPEPGLVDVSGDRRIAAFVHQQ